MHNFYETHKFIFQPQRKSYGKAKKVVFCQPSTSDSDSQSVNVTQPVVSSDDEGDINDLTFEMPVVEEKKPRKKRSKKQKMTKKEVRKYRFSFMCVLMFVIYWITNTFFSAYYKIILK